MAVGGMLTHRIDKLEPEPWKDDVWGAINNIARFINDDDGAAESEAEEEMATSKEQIVKIFAKLEKCELKDHAFFLELAAWKFANQRNRIWMWLPRMSWHFLRTKKNH